MAKTFDYYFDFGSLATYLAHTQMEKIKSETGATPNYLPMLLGSKQQETLPPSASLPRASTSLLISSVLQTATACH
jgi:2-hydroxychromene-2-carboxylate isomerase